MFLFYSIDTAAVSGILLVVSFNNQSAIDGLSSAYEQGALQPIIQEYFVGAELLRAVGATAVELRVRLWPDELARCRAEFTAGSVPRLGLLDRGARSCSGLVRRSDVSRFLFSYPEHPTPPPPAPETG